jgi:hypothetical protein
MDVNDLVLRSSKTRPIFAVVESFVDNRTMALLLVLTFFLLATWTEGPVLVW